MQSLRVGGGRTAVTCAQQGGAENVSVGDDAFEVDMASSCATATLPQSTVVDVTAASHRPPRPAKIAQDACKESSRKVFSVLVHSAIKRQLPASRARAKKLVRRAAESNRVDAGHGALDNDMGTRVAHDTERDRLRLKPHE